MTLQLLEMEKDILAIDVNGDYGYILEVDIDYPVELHDLHNDYPFLPEKRLCGKTEKLCATLENKRNYVVHMRNLQQAVQHGLKLIKIHRAMTFYQCAWMSGYIARNNEHRKNAKSKSEKDLFKLMNNAPYGKSIENIEKRRQVRLCNSWETRNHRRGASFYVASEQLKRIVEFDDTFVACELRKGILKFDKPIQIGFAILELAKLKMYQFHYEYMLPKYGCDSVRICYTDTDSFVYALKTDNFYKDLAATMMSKNNQLFDTSGYPENNKYGIVRKNEKLLGAMKDECNGQIMTDFCGLRSKVYCFNTMDCNESVKKCKGAVKAVVDELKPDDYITSLDDPHVNIYRQQFAFRSELHTIYTDHFNKSVLNSNDDKRYVLRTTETPHDTLAWGHYMIMDVNLLTTLESQ